MRMKTKSTGIIYTFSW